MASEGDVVGASVLEVGADGAGFESAIGRMTKSAQGFERAAVDSASKADAAVSGIGKGRAAGAAQQDAASKRFIASLEREVNQLSLTRTEYRKLQAEQLGIAESVYAPLIKRLDEANAAQGRLGKGAQQAGGELAQMRGGLQGVGTAADAVRTTFARLGVGGVLSVAGISAFLKSTTDGILALKDLSEATGASIEQISKLEVVARRSGTGFDTVNTAVLKFNQALNTADGKNRASLALREIGLEAEKLKLVDPAEGVRQVAQALQGFADDGTKGRYILELFGKSAREMGPALKEWADAGEVTATVTSEMVDEADKFSKSLAALNVSALDASRAIAGPVVSAINQLFDAVSGKGVGGSETLSDLIVIPLQTASVLAANVAFVMRGIGTEIGGIAAQAAAMARLDLSGARTIGEAMRKDAAAARAEFDALERRLMSIGRELPQASYSNEGRTGPAKALRDLAALEAAARKASEAANKRDAFGPMLRDIEDLIRANEQRLDLGRELTKSEQLELSLNNKLADSLKGLQGPQQDLLRAAIARAVASERNKEAQVEEQKAAEKHLATLAAVAQQSTKLIDAEAATTAQTRQQLVALRARNDQLSSSEAAYAGSTVATMRAEAADLEWQAAMQGGNYQLEERARLLRGMASATEQASLLAGSRTAAEANAAAARQAADDWQRTADSIRGGLTDAFRRAFESGEDFGTAFAKTIGNEIQARIASALAGLLADGVLRIGGVALTAAAGSTGGNGASDWLRGASTAKDVYGLYSGSYAAAGNYAAVYSGQAYGTGLASQQSAMLAAQEAGMISQAGSSTMSGWGASAGWIAAAIIGAMKASSDYSEGFRRDQARDVSRTTWGGGGGLGDLQPMGGLESGRANFLSQLGFSDRIADLLSGSTAVAKMFGRAGPRIEASGISGTVGAGDFTGQAFADIIEKGGVFRSDKKYQQFAEIPEEIGRMLDGAAAGVRDRAKMYGEALGLPVAQLDGITEEIKVALTDDTEANGKALLEAMSGYGDALVKGYAEALKPLANYGETTVQTIERVGSALVSVNDALEQLSIDEFAKSITGAQSAFDLAGRFGGADQLRTAAGTFSEAFTAEGEKVALLTARLSSELSKLGLQMPDLGDSADRARAQYADLVRAQDLNTKAGQDAFAALLGLSEAFDTVADRAESLQRDLTRAIDGAIEAYSPQARTRSQFERVATDLADVGVTVSVDQIIGASREEIATFAQAFVGLESNSIEARTAVATAAEALFGLKDAAADASAAIDRRRDSLEIDLLRAQGRELEAVARERQAELAALRELNPALARVKESTYAAVDAARVLAGLDGVISDFASGMELARFRASRIQTTLAGGGIEVSIEDIMGATSDEIVDLWHAVGDAGKQAILDSYGALITLQSDLTKEQRKSIEDQIAGMKGLRDLAKDIAQFTASLKFSDLSPLSAEAQIAQAQALFETTLTKARDGDTTAQGALLSNAQAYLEELSAAFASGPSFTREFDRVTAALDQLGLEGEALDPQIKILEDIFGNDRKMLDTLVEIRDTLTRPEPIVALGPDAGSRYGLPDVTESGLPQANAASTQTAAASPETVELLKKQVERLTDAVTALNAIATIGQAAARENKVGFESVRGPLQEIADIERLRR